MTDETEVQGAKPVEVENPAQTETAAPVSPQVSASTAHVYGLIEHLKSEWLALEEKFSKALADLRSHL